jgi:hypothetical protein
MKQVCLTERNREMATKAGTRTRHTEPAIVGFALGCAQGAACEVIVGLWSLALPTGLALVARDRTPMMSVNGRKAAPVSAAENPAKSGPGPDRLAPLGFLERRADDRQRARDQQGSVRQL